MHHQAGLAAAEGDRVRGGIDPDLATVVLIHDAIAVGVLEDAERRLPVRGLTADVQLVHAGREVLDDGDVGPPSIGRALSRSTWSRSLPSPPFARTLSESASMSKMSLPAMLVLPPGRASPHR